MQTLKGTKCLKTTLKSKGMSPPNSRAEAM